MTPKQKAAMQAALRLAESIARPTSRGSWNPTTIQLREHCDVLRAALAEVPVLEPVAHINSNGIVHAAGYPWEPGEVLTPLYASPPPAEVPLLTDDEIRTIFLAHAKNNAHGVPYLTAYLESAAHLVRQVEQVVLQKAGLKS